MSTPMSQVTTRHFQVVRVIDGHKIMIAGYDGEDTSVRLPRVNAPEPSEPGGVAAAEALRQLVDRQGRTDRVHSGPQAGPLRAAAGQPGVYVTYEGTEVIDDC